MSKDSLLNGKWVKLRGAEISVSYHNKKLTLENKGDTHGFILVPKLKKFTSADLQIDFSGKVLEGKPCTFKLLNRYKTILAEVDLNTKAVISKGMIKYYIYCIQVAAKSKVEIDTLRVFAGGDYCNLYEQHFKGDVLLVVPGYPSASNKYMMGFVHTRVKAYKKLGWNIDVACISEYLNTSIYEYEGIQVFKSSYFHLREVLRKKSYDKILIHFFDDRYANVLDSVDLSSTKLYFYLHGAETLYWDWEKLVSPYFLPATKINDSLREIFYRKDEVIKKYNDYENAKWLFVTPWTKKRCEDLVGIQFKNYDIIPCLIDTEQFYYEKKDSELRKKIFVLRKFEDINSYSLDIDVRVVLELSRREFFNDLEFHFYGDGSMFEQILAPLEKFDNVIGHKTFLNHEQIKQVHRECGIALFATRFDSQAVSSCEAASSGCVVVSSDIPGVRQLFPQDANIMCQTENYIEYADVIERLYRNPDEFVKLGKILSDSVQNKFDYEHTIQKELDMFKEEELTFTKPKYKKQVENPVLTVVVPSYNVEKYLRHGVMSLIQQENAHKIEVLIINDGSKDRTAEIGRELEILTTTDDCSIVKVINKENGGHGSTINEGIKLARGKYLKVMDGDDTVDSLEFAKLINILEMEEVDIVLSDYYEDFETTNKFNRVCNYTFMKPGIKYYFDDLCIKDYGFTSWGPILACSSYRTDFLKKAGFKLSEKMFYVDMELNTNIAVFCNTLKYYPLTVYRYLLGREGQSVNYESYKRNYKNHENVLFNMLNTLKQHEDVLSWNKKCYIIYKLILPMISTQYVIVIQYHSNGNAFREFDSRLRGYPEFYNDSSIIIRKVRFHRRTRGVLVRFHGIFVKMGQILQDLKFNP